MRIRRIVLIFIIAFAILYLFNISNNGYLVKPQRVEVKTLLNDFKNLSDNNELLSELPRKDISYSLYVPKNFTGQAGDVFYIVLEKDEKKIFKYKLESVKINGKTVLKYSIKNTFTNIILPTNKFSIYKLN